MNHENTLQVALDHVAAKLPEHDTPDGGKALVVPSNYRVERINPVEPPLMRIKQVVTMHDRDSLIAYLTRFKTNNTQIFAEPGFLANGQAQISAVIDYHAPATPDRLAHAANYLPRYSEQWQRWVSACRAPMKQAAFAEFVEECRGDIAEPEAAKLLDIVRTFKASKKVEFDSVVYQPNGDVRLGYDERTEQKGSSGILPEMMKLGIPVYFRGTVYAVPVYVRFRVSDGAVQFQLKMDRADVIEDAAFGELTGAISEATGIGVYLGRR